jgi:hypothetical protein
MHTSPACAHHPHMHAMYGLSDARRVYECVSSYRVSMDRFLSALASGVRTLFGSDVLCGAVRNANRRSRAGVRADRTATIGRSRHAERRTTQRTTQTRPPTHTLAHTARDNEHRRIEATAASLPRACELDVFARNYRATSTHACRTSSASIRVRTSSASIRA